MIPIERFQQLLSVADGADPDEKASEDSGRSATSKNEPMPAEARSAEPVRVTVVLRASSGNTTRRGRALVPICLGILKNTHGSGVRRKIIVGPGDVIAQTRFARQRECVCDVMLDPSQGPYVIVPCSAEQAEYRLTVYSARPVTITPVTKDWVSSTRLSLHLRRAVLTCCASHRTGTCGG